MRILTVNAGSTSLKLERYELGGPSRGGPGVLPPIAEPPPPLESHDVTPADGDEAIGKALEAEIDLVVHRVVRPPPAEPVVFELDERSQTEIRAVAGDAPLHDAPMLHAAAIVRKVRPNVPQFAVADGAFHRTLSLAASTYAIPRELTEKGFRRLGYHGLSHEYAAHRGARLSGLDINRLRVASLHLGGGSSLCAIRDGASIDTTMGYTPLEGVPMGTRSGSVDPGLLTHLLRTGLSVGELEQILEQRSGLLGISGRSADVRELLARRGDDPDSALALDVFVWRLRAALGAMIGVLMGVDLIVFTGGIGEHAAEIRADVLEGASFWGARLDRARNVTLEAEGRISTDESAVKICVVRARENWMLARSVASALAA